ncbi:CBD9-like protein [Microthyrium microscopicum]|uniref:CBD9-like protein n=1 Tax=Microthyrium microscopicum TaxID=703497 RepID=A0A6A6U2K5_9PEZI|nr:CBD9-like protein [Microthyrium microscopicum]
MRLLLPLFAGLIPFVSSFSLPDLSDILPRQNAPSNAPSNSTFDTAPVSQAGFEKKLGGSTEINFGFILTLDKATGDIRFRIAGPSTYSYIAFGTGNEMTDSMMFILYRGSTQNKVTLSGRYATGNKEPTQTSRMNLTVIDPADGDNIGNTVDSSAYYITGLCKACASIPKTPLDVTNKKQNFIYAIGPRGRDTYSDALNAPLRRHVYHGTFTLDMTSADSSGIPSFAYNSTFTAQVQDPNNLDPDYKESGHAFLMLLIFVILLPLGILFIRVFENSNRFNTAHQIIGILVIVLFLVQWGLGAFNHRSFLRTRTPVKWAIGPHKHILGPLLIAGGILNAPLGFRLALNPQLNWLYLPVVVVIFVALAVFSWYKARSVARQKALAAGAGASQGAPYNAGEQNNNAAPPAYTAAGTGPYQHTGAYAADRSDIALSNLGEPPAYNAQPTRPREFA